MNSKMIAAAIAGAALSIATPAMATTFVFTGGNSFTYGAAGNSSGPITVGGLTVTATAWSTDALPVGNTPETAYLGRYSSGFGVTNGNEGYGNSDNSHTVDNVGSYDFIRLAFSQSVKLTGMTLAGFPVTGGNTVDTDAWVSYGTGAFNSSALWQGYLDRGVNVDSGMTFTSNNAGTTWLIGAARTSNDRDDGFKLAGVTVQAVPEPSTWALLLVGFGAVGTMLRRRKRPVLAPA